MPTPLPEDGAEDVYSASDKEEQDADGDDDHNEDAEGEGDEVQDKDAEAEEDEPSSKRRSIILKRRGPPRSSRNSSLLVDESPRPALPMAKQDHQYEDVPFKGLDFQQAQEKIVEEMLRHHEPE